MAACNYLYLVALFSFWSSLLVLNLFVMGLMFSAFGAGGCSFVWKRVEDFVRSRWSERGICLCNAMRRGFLYFLCPLLIVSAAGLLWWAIRTDRPAHVGLVEGREAGARARVWGVDLRWVPNGRASCWMMEREVSRDLWARLYAESGAGGPDYPMAFVSSYAIRMLVRDLERLHPVRGWTWRVPSDRQWQTACLAGSRELSREDNLRQGWFLDNGKRRTHPVGTREPNDWGFLDMVGNLSEYVHEECGVWLMGGDYLTPSGDGLLTGFCSADPSDGYLWTTRCSETDEDLDGGCIDHVGLRLCLEPTCVVHAYPGSHFILDQTPAVIVASNFVLIYGLLFLFRGCLWRIVGKRIEGTRLSRLFRLLALEGLRLWVERTCSRWGKWIWRACELAMDWLIGLFVVSPLSLLIPGLPDPDFPIPDELLAFVVGCLVTPIVVTSILVCRYVRDWLGEKGWPGVGEHLRTAYLWGVLPLAIVFSAMVFSDYARLFWYAFAGRESRAIVVTPEKCPSPF